MSYFRRHLRIIQRLPPGKVETLDVPPDEHAVGEQQRSEHDEVALQIEMQNLNGCYMHLY